MSIEAMKQALEVLTDKGQLHPDDYKEKKNEAITALSTAIEQAEKQEPVAWRHEKFYEGASGWFYADWHSEGLNPPSAQLLYTTPPAAQRQLVGLTERETELLDGMIAVQLDHAARCDGIANRTMAEKQKGWDMERVALLQKLKEKNT
jgi:hypothetical protein